MNKFQALFVLYLRHEKFCGCSLRALAAHFFNRYTNTYKLKPIEKRQIFEVMTIGGNQIDGMLLEQQAYEILVRDESIDALGILPNLYDCDLTYLDANLRNNCKI